MPRRVFITAAEVSGDRYAAGLARSLRQLDPQIELEGFGGEAMRQAGVVVHQDTVTRAAMGLRALLRAGEVWKLLRLARRRLAEHPADLHVCVDSWAMNRHFARLAKKNDTPVLYYVSPQVWASRPGRVRVMRRLVDQVACILPFEQDYLRQRGVQATFVGHPLFDTLPARPDSPLADARPPEAPLVIGLACGSRRKVAADNAPRLRAVARRIRQAFPSARFVSPTTAATDAIVRQNLAELDGIEIGLDAFDELIPRCDLCLTVSGTATLHIAAHRAPMLVVYYGHPLAWHLLGRWIVHTRTFALVNLLSPGAGRIVPEFIPWHGSTEVVAEAAIALLRQPEARQRQRRQLQELIQTLQQRGASAKTAEIAMKMMK